MWRRHDFWSDSGKEGIQRLRLAWTRAPYSVHPEGADAVADRLGISGDDFRELYRWDPGTMGPTSIRTDPQERAVLRGERVFWERSEDFRPQLNNLLVMHCPGSMTLDQFDELAGKILDVIDHACAGGTDEVS